jgi:FkbM family methyltransferase
MLGQRMTFKEEEYVKWLVNSSTDCISNESLYMLTKWSEECKKRFTLTVRISKVDAELLLPCSQLPEAWANIIHVFCLNDYGLGERVYIDNNSVVIDAGAYLGFFSILAAFHGAKLIVALEPNPLVREYLYNNLLHNKLINKARVDPRALSVEDDKILYLYIPDYWGNSSLVEDYVKLMGYSEARRVPVRSVTLSSLLKEHHLPRVDLLKMDIEGLETHVLHQSAREGVLAPDIISQVVVEVHEPLRENVEIVSSTLRSQGYRVNVKFFGDMWRQAVVYGVAKY